MRAAALSVDLDPLEGYRRLYGIPGAPPGADPVYGRASERFGDLCAGLGIRGTVFAVGESLADPAAAVAVRRLAGAGHEVANHSYSHDYALTRRAPAEIASEVRRGGEAIQAVAGRAPTGFRAPGYTISAALLAELSAQGYRYDSSALPAAPYFAAKAAALALLALAGRRSQAILDRPRAVLAPNRPYRPSWKEPYARGDLRLVELPVTAGRLGIPLVGTFLAALPAAAARALLAGKGALPLFNLELHGMDFLDRSDVPGELGRWQPGLGTSAAVKVSRLEALLRSIGREWLTLEDAAARLAPT